MSPILAVRVFITQVVGYKIELLVNLVGVFFQQTWEVWMWDGVFGDFNVCQCLQGGVRGWSSLVVPSNGTRGRNDTQEVAPEHEEELPCAVTGH